ncbi:MAG: hypothetical protein H0V14_01625 [Chitinophagaceae bacterium]|nr:hypothetical protein [Chitinophagaceae bacterium]
MVYNLIEHFFGFGFPSTLPPKLGPIEDMALRKPMLPSGKAGGVLLLPAPQVSRFQHHCQKNKI